jgi:hypothetical protein
MSHPPSWSAVLDRLQEAIAQALRDVEARAEHFPSDEPAFSTAVPVPDCVKEPLRRAEAATAEADAALAEVEGEVQAWLAKAGRRGGA